MNELKKKLYGPELEHELKVGDRVRALVFPEAVFGTVTKIIGSAVFINDTMCAHANVVQKLPSLDDIGFATKFGVH
jgi:hypothetical protein